eukprot:snap_masked-scaffold425_size175135-processed-gene-0.22 protein:Tk05836 transcript:snap_masked-scaffold425_size175135-processed-gene-0.22-mRNA-1 annotation:"thioredoxin domain-containing protein 12"
MWHCQPRIGWLLCAAFASVLLGTRAQDNGWNEQIGWVSTWDEALQRASAEHKPICLLIHRTWCGACHNLRPQFVASTAIEGLSQHLVMINSADEAEFTDEQFAPDGGYVPRILFFDPQGRLYPEIVSRTDKFQYFHSQTDTIVEAMQRVLALGDRSKSEL